MNNMNNAITNTVSPGSATARNGTATANSTPEDLFGPVMQKQTDLQSKASSGTASKDGKNSQSSAENAGTSTTAPVSAEQKRSQSELEDNAVPDSRNEDKHAASGSRSTEAVTAEPEDKTSDVATQSESSSVLAVLADGDADSALTTQGKILPAGGNNLPPAGSLAERAGASVVTVFNGTDAELTGDDAGDGLEHPVSGRLAGRNADVAGSFTQSDVRVKSGDSSFQAQLSVGLQADTATEFRVTNNNLGAALSGDSLLAQADMAESIDMALLTSGANTDTDTPQLSGGGALNGVDKLTGTRLATAASTAANTQFQINAPVDSPDWGNQIGDRIRWMSKADISLAELKLNPAELGSIEVKIYTEDQQTRVSFITSNAATKEMLESTLPRLREMLLGSGLQLEHSDISHRNDSNTGDAAHTASEQSQFDEADSAGAQLLVRPRVNPGQIDHYV